MAVKMNKGLHVALLFAALPLASNAGELRISGDRCDTEIEVTARGVPLSETLKAMADRFGFSFAMQANRDPLLDFTRRATPETVLRELTASSNLIAVHRMDADCGHAVIAEVKLLGEGEGERLVYVPDASVEKPGTQSLPPEKQMNLPQGTRRSMSAEEWQVMKQQRGKSGAAMTSDKTKPESTATKTDGDNK